MFYEINTWKNYIGTDDCFHFDAAGESLLGIEKKIKFLDKRHTKISHSLIILDYLTLSQVNEIKDHHIQLMHPALSNQNWISFQFEFFKTFLSKDFFIAYLDFTLNKHIKDYMKKDFLLNDDPIEYNKKYNEIKYTSFENFIKTSPNLYYNVKKMKVFYYRDTIQKYSPKIISEPQYKLLSNIVEILKKDKTEYKIIISPLYDQLKLNNEDLATICKLFGKENVFDFSGINFITKDYHNYYENSHYRPHIANYIMKEIYKKETKSY